MKVTLAIFCCMTILISAGSLAGQGAKPRAIDAATREAWKKLDTTHLETLGSYFPGWELLPSDIPVKMNLPGFSLWSLPKADLPDVGVPFGLDLYHSRVADKDLKRLAPLKNLTVLTLRETGVTDDGLKELASLKNWLFRF